MAENVLIDKSHRLRPYPHGMLYYNGYVYVAMRNDAYCAARVYRVKGNDYSDFEYTISLWGDNAGLTDIIRIGEYLYVASHKKAVMRIDTATFKVDVISITANMGNCLCEDGTYLYIGHQGYNGRITRLNLTTLEFTEHDLGAGLDWHSICIDGDILYANDTYNGRLYRINKGTMIVVDFATTGVCADDIAQDDDYVYLSRETVTAGVVRVTKSDMSVTVYTPDGIGFGYGVFIIDDRIFYLDRENDYIWEFVHHPITGLTLVETWIVPMPDGYAGINELVYDGERFFHCTTFTTPGLIRFAIGVATYDETAREQVILARAGHIYPLKPARLALAINNSYVDVANVKISLRTINQGHSLFTAMVDNLDNKYIGIFDAKDKVSIVFRKNGTYYEIFRGILDSSNHILSQDDKWSLSDRIRLGGRDMSYALANFKYTKTWPLGREVVHALYEAFAATKCGVSIAYAESPKINGKTDIDKFLIDMVGEMFEIAEMEGYVNVHSDLKYYELSAPPSIPLTFNKTNVLSAAPIEFDGLDIKNSIEVLGELNLTEPEPEDRWTDSGSLGYWTKLIGDVLWIEESGVTNLCVKCSTVWVDTIFVAHIRLTLPNPIRVGYHGQYKEFSFRFYTPFDWWPDNDMFRVYMISPYGGFYTDIDFSIQWIGDWLLFKQKLGEENTISPDLPNGLWHPFGANPDWLNIIKVEFYGLWHNDAVDDALILDAMKFSPKRTHYLEQNQASIRAYGKREHTIVTDYGSNEECKYAAESLSKKLSNPVSILQLVTPLETFIIDGAWEGKVGHTVTVDKEILGVSSDATYRIQDITIDIVPYENLRHGHDALATVNLVKVADTFEPDAYASTARPKTASLLKRYVTKGA